MAKDREIVLIEGEEYEINPYTIKYDSNAKRFFKGFAPKLGYGSIGVGILAGLGLGVATVVSGGIAGLSAGVVATVAAGSVGVGTAIQAGYSASVYGKNSSVKRFKNIGIGGNTGDVGTIGIIESCEAKAHKYTLLLQEMDKQADLTNSKHPKKVKLEDGVTYSRRDLLKRIKENEDMAYHGLKYVLDQGIQVSAEINKLIAKTNPTERERAKLDKYWNVMDRIGACVKNVTSERIDFNPYKGLILDAMEQGCLLGDYNQNNSIRQVATLNDREETLKLYFEMYERELLERHKVVIPAEPAIDKREYEAVKAKVAKLEADNASLLKLSSGLGEDLAKAKKSSKRNITTAWNKRVENKELRKKLDEQYKRNDLLEEELKRLRKISKSLTTKVSSLESDVERAVSGWYESEEELKAFKAKTEKDIEAVLRKSAQLIADEKEKVRAMGEDYDELEAEFEKLEAEMEKLEKLNSKLKVDAKRYEKRAHTAESRNAVMQGKYERAVKRGVDQRAKANYFKDRAEQAEDTVKAMYEGRVEVEQQNKYWQDRAESAEDAVKVAHEGRTKAERKNKVLTKQVAEAGKATVKYVQESVEAKAEAKKAQEELTATKETLKRVRKGRSDDKKRATKTIEAQQEEISRPTEEHNTMVIAQGENIDRIIELEHEAEVSRETMEDLAWDLRKTKSELAAMTDERDAYKTGVEELEDAKKQLEEKLQVAEDKADYTQAWVDYQQANFERGGKLHKLGELLMRVDAHIEYTKEMQEDYDKEAVDALSEVADIIRRKDPELMSKDDVVASGTVLTKAYRLYIGKLQAVTSKELNKVIDEIYSSNPFTKK